MIFLERILSIVLQPREFLFEIYDSEHVHKKFSSFQ